MEQIHTIFLRRCGHKFRRLLLLILICCSILIAVTRFYDSDTDTSIDPKIFRSANYTKLELTVRAGKLLSTFRCNTRPIKLLIVVTSHAASFQRRTVIRNTWGKNKFSHRNDDFRTFFAVGHVNNASTTRRVSAEAAEYGDIVTGDFDETFYNNSYNQSYKFEMILEWAYKYCTFRHLLKGDDDVFVNISKLFEILNLYGSDAHKRFYAGRADQSAGVFRTASKYAVTYAEYSAPRYPPFVAGGAAIFSPDVVGAVIPYFFPTPFKLDDVYIGFLVANTNTTRARHMPQILLFEEYCLYDDNAVALHLVARARKRKSVQVCMFELFYNMLTARLNDEFVYRHYINRG